MERLLLVLCMILLLAGTFVLSQVPTHAPTTMDLSHTVVMAFSVGGLDTALATTNENNIINLLATSASVSTSQVTVLSLSRRKLADVVGYTDSDSFVSTALPTFVKFFRRRLANANVQIQVNGFVTGSAATAALAALTTYLESTTATGFVSQLNTVSGLSLAGGASISSSTAADPALAATLAGFANSCVLDKASSNADTLYWNVDPGLQYVSAFYLHKGSNTKATDWIAVGPVGGMQMDMVGDGAINSAFLYTPTVAQSPNHFYYNIMDTAASGITDAYNPARTTEHFGVTWVQSVNSGNYVTMAFEYCMNTGVYSDTKLLLGPGNGNRIIWASTSGKTWPAEHSNAGFMTVNWSDGTCAAVMTPMSIPYQCCALLGLIIMLYNSKLSPLRNTYRCIPGLNSLKRLHPKVISRWVGNKMAYFGSLDEKNAATYTIPSTLMMFVYVLVNVMIVVTNYKVCGVPMTTGQVAVVNMWITLIPSSKTSVVLFMTGVPFERAIKYHKMIAFVGFGMTMAHFWIARQSMLDMGMRGMDVFSFDLYMGDVYPGFGTLALIFYTLMFLMAFEFIRTAKYEVFYVVHQFWLVAVIMNMLHFQLGDPNQLGFLPGLLLHLVDKLDLVSSRPLMSQCKAITGRVSAGEVDKEAAGGGSSRVVALRVVYKPSYSRLCDNAMYKWLAAFSNRVADYAVYLQNGCRDARLSEYESFHWGLGQYYWINVPAVSVVEWHPFSVSEIKLGKPGNSTDGVLSFHVKAMPGESWTAKLARLVSTGRAHEATGQVDVEVKLRGPYGSLSVNLADYSHIFLIAGGIGITPMLPILDRVRYWCTNDKARKFPSLNRVTVVWVARKENLSIFEEFADRIQLKPRSSSKGEVELSTVLSDSGASFGSEPSLYETVETVSALHKSRKSVFAAAPETEVNWETHYYITGCKEEDIAFHGLSGTLNECVVGRPNLRDMLKEAAAGAAAAAAPSKHTSHVCALVCGPAAMSADAAIACADNGIDYHLETFGW